MDMHQFSITDTYPSVYSSILNSTRCRRVMLDEEQTVSCPSPDASPCAPTTISIGPTLSGVAVPSVSRNRPNRPSSASALQSTLSASVQPSVTSGFCKVVQLPRPSSTPSDLISASNPIEKPRFVSDSKDLPVGRGDSPIVYPSPSPDANVVAQSSVGELPSCSPAEHVTEPTSEVDNSYHSPYFTTVAPTTPFTPSPAVCSSSTPCSSDQVTSPAPDDCILRPLSAPKRLYGDVSDMAPESSVNFLHCGSFDRRIANAAIPEESVEDDESVEPPKSTLEALVASNSPMLFFPTGYSVDASQESGALCDFLTGSPASKQPPTPGTGYDTSDPKFPLSVEQGQADFLSTDMGSDILNSTNSTNSVSSSKSLASVDLGEPNTKETDPHSNSSPKSNLSEMGVSSDTLMNEPNSMTMQLTAFVEAMRSYAAELCPVDCVILMERCRPFNCDTQFMKHFREQYLSPILSNLNGGPPLNADFGRDAYTSLYSLHGFHWRKPHPTYTWVPDTPIIYRILKRIATVQHEERHASSQSDVICGIPGNELLLAAVEAFGAIDRVRRGLCKQVRRHLLLLTVSPINLTEVYEDDALSSATDSDSPSPNTGRPLDELRRHGVALSVFSPVPSQSLLQLYKLINGITPSPLYDRRWQTVVLSAQLNHSESADRRMNGPMAAEVNASADTHLIKEQHRHAAHPAHHHQHNHHHHHHHLQSHHHQQPQQMHLLPPQSTMADTTGTVSLTNGHQLTGVVTQQMSPNSPVRAGGGGGGGGRFHQHLPHTCAYGATPMVQPTSGSPTRGGVGQDGVYRTTVPHGKTSAPLVAGSPSAAGQSYQMTSAGSPLSQTPRGSRNSGLSHGLTSPGQSARGMRPGPDSHRLTENTLQPTTTSSLSTGHSGPNSVDQFGPSSVYGSDSVATPQGLSCSILSPQQQGYPMSNQIHSPASIVPVTTMLSNAPPPSSQASHQGLPIGTYPNYTSQPVFDGQMQQQCLNRSLPPSSPIQMGQNTPAFRPPSNAAASPGAAQFNTGYVGTMGLPSPSAATRNVPSRQYSPQVSQVPSGQQQQQRRHPSPHAVIPGGGGSQTVRSQQQQHQLVSPDMAAAVGARSRSITPTNFPPSNPPAVMTAASNAAWLASTPNPSMPTSHAGGGGGGYDAQPHHRSTCPPLLSAAVSVAGYAPTSGQSAPRSVGMVSSNGMQAIGHKDGTNISPNPNEAVFRRLDPALHSVPGQQQSMRHQQQQQQQLSPLDHLQQQNPQQQQPLVRSVIWEGEAHMTDSNISSRLSMRLIYDQSGMRDISHLNMQLWGPTAQLSIILAHRESALVQRLASSVPGGYLLARVLVDLPQSEETFNLISALSNSGSPMHLPLGILSPPPNTLPNPLPAGAVAFICLNYTPKRNRIYGLIPSDSEQFRLDLPPRQSVKSALGGGGGLMSDMGSGPRPVYSSASAVLPSVSNMPGTMVAGQDDVYVVRAGMTQQQQQSTFASPNCGPTGYVTVPQRTVVESTNLRATSTIPAGSPMTALYNPATQQNVSYQACSTIGPQQSMYASQMPPGVVMAKNQHHQSVVMTSQPRHTPSPPASQSHRYRDPSHGNPESAGPPPQWMQSVDGAGMGLVSQSPHPTRGQMKTTHSLSLSQQPFTQRSSPGPTCVFPPSQVRSSVDQFSTGSANPSGPVVVMTSQPPMLSSEQQMMVIDHQSMQRHSPHLTIPTTHHAQQQQQQQQQRFIPNPNNNTNNPQFSTSIPHGHQPGYPMVTSVGYSAEPQAFNPRTIYTGQPSLTLSGMEAYPGCYPSRALMTSSQMGSIPTSYHHQQQQQQQQHRFIQDPGPNSIMSQPNYGGSVVATKHNPSQIDTGGFAVTAMHSMPVDTGAMHQALQASQAGRQQAGFVSAPNAQDCPQTGHLIHNPSVVYGSVRPGPPQW